ncbi:hypothetical protein [Arsukibacterium indicum]|uniref:Uncharacterized protein n=1 Tax=Arsukibacterium indicum TaxID=2848612 RepID=A0ABS6MG37_9GAMM|nr:hypothetical protein [Arsukibacterium indicum]MBV2127782.1 hypothetical protein [Arsukibacterium indicum]
MKTTFKKTLLAVAVAGFSVNAVAAVNIVDDSTAVAFSTERLSNTATTVTIPRENLEVTLGAEYAVGDIITFTFSNDAIAASQFKSTITTSDTLNADGTPAANVAGSPVTLGLLSSTATSVTYRVTEVSTATTTVGQKFTIAAGATFAANAAKLQSGSGLTVTYAAQTSSGVTIDAGTKSSFKLVYTASEFSTAVTTLDAIIDVNDSRLSFTGATFQDALGVTVSQNPTFDPDGTGPMAPVAFLAPVTYVSSKYVVNGDFSWVTDTSSTTAGVQAPASAVAITGCTGATDGATGVTFTATSMTFTCTDAPATAVTATFDVRQGGAKAPAALNASTYTVTNTINYNTGTAQTLEIGPKSAGAWTLNGSQVRVPYMVVGGGRFGIIANVTNHGSKSGNITLDVFAEDGTTIASNYAAGTSAPGSVTSVAGALNAALSAAGVSTTSPVKFSFQITTNVPENDVIVYAAYTDNTTSERAIVNNDSKVQTK